MGPDQAAVASRGLVREGWAGSFLSPRKRWLELLIGSLLPSIGPEGNDTFSSVASAGP